MTLNYLSGQSMLQDGNISSIGSTTECDYCNDIYFYPEPPPDDLMLFIPPPPIHPSFKSIISELVLKDISNKQTNEKCNYCNLLYYESAPDTHLANTSNISNIIIISIIVLLTFGLVLGLLFGIKRRKVLDFFNSIGAYKTRNLQNVSRHTLHNHNNTLQGSISNAASHITDNCFLQTDKEKNLISPIISEHPSDKKTSIPSNCWAQPNSIIGNTMRRIPNEYEFASSRTNSGASSALYAELNNEPSNVKFFSPYNNHTYSEVRGHFLLTSSNSSAVQSESNYNNHSFSQNGATCPTNTITTEAPFSSVQMSDFNSIRTTMPTNYGQSNIIQNNDQGKLYFKNGQPMMDHVSQKAQVIITSNNNGTSAYHYRDRIRDVI